MGGGRGGGGAGFESHLQLALDFRCLLQSYTLGTFKGFVGRFAGSGPSLLGVLMPLSDVFNRFCIFIFGVFLEGDSDSFVLYSCCLLWHTRRDLV